ncbi:MAG: ABC transporter permease [Gemmatimonadales bacterium]
MVIAIYRRLVRLLPHRVREAYGAEILLLFTEEVSAARRMSWRSAWRVAALGVLDLLLRLPREHWRAAGAFSTEEAMQSFWYDLRPTCRTLLHQRGSAAMILTTLTLAVACNASVFTLLDGVFLRPFPFRDPGRLVYLNEQAPKWNLEFTGINYPDFAIWRTSTRRFASMSAYVTNDFNVALPGGAERDAGALVSWALARTLGVKPVLGRTFRADEDRPNGPNVVMISYRFWKSRFLGARDVVGRTLQLDGTPFTVVGVLPDKVEFPGDVQLWTPLDADPSAATGPSYEYDGIGRLKPGVTIAAARADLLAAHEAIWRASDTAHVVSPRIMPLRERFDGDFQSTGRILALSAAIVLLVACANIAAAMLVRATSRRRELAVRVALGASGNRIARQILTESLLFAAVAGVAGAILGWWGIRALALGSSGVPAGVRLDFDWRMTVFCAATMGLVTLLFGTAPALDARREGLLGAVSLRDRSGSTSVRERRVLDILVVAEIALATVLLVGGGLLVRAFRHVQAEDPGFRVSGALQFSLSLPQTTYPTSVSQGQFYQRVIDGLNATPGVTSGAAITCPPLGCHWGRFYNAEGATRAPGSDDPVVLMRLASAQYFGTMGVRFVEGRWWTAGEARPEGTETPVVVNEEFVQAQWPGATSAVGRRISERAKGSPWMTIIGVVHDARHYGLDQPMRPGIYLPMSWIDSHGGEVVSGYMTFVAHTNGDPRALYSDVRALIRRLDPTLPVIRLETMRDAVDASLQQRRSTMLVLSAFASIALALAVGGVYAVLSYIVGRRRREIGIRMALGALGRQMVGMVILRAAVLIGIGLAIGLPLAFAVARVLGSLLTGVSAVDGASYLAAVLLLVVTGIAAAIAPAIRAAAVDPRSALSEP